MDIVRKSEKTPRLRAAGVFFCGLVFVMAAFAGCSAIHFSDTSFTALEKGGKGGFEYVQEVPFYPGEEYQCGPSVLASVLNYHGYDIKPEDISKEIYLHGVRGTLNIDMASFAGRFDDLAVAEYRGEITSLKEDLSMGHPLIVFVDLGIWSIRKGHYMLVVGYDDGRDGFIVYSGADKDKLIRYDDFTRVWKRGSYWTLRITKKNDLISIP